MGGQAQVIRLVLYVKGALGSSERAMRNVRRAIGRRDHIQLDVRDLTVEPLRDDEDPVVMIPTLVVCSPPPRRVLIGELDDVDALRDLFFDATSRPPRSRRT